MRRLRLVLAGLGTVVAAYGLWLLLDRQSDEQVRQVVEWAIAGVILHDAVLAPACLLGGWLWLRVLPRTAASWAVAVVVVGTATVAALPALWLAGLPHANHTLLDRDYVVGWFQLAGAGALAAAVATIVVSRRRRRGHGEGAAGR